MFQSPCNMDRTVLQYYSFTITLLSLIGLWPYQNENLRRFLNRTICILLTIVVIAQLIPFVTTRFEMLMLIKNMWSVVVTLGSLGKYIAFWQQAKLLKALMEDVIHDWNSMDDEELKILKKHANIGRRYSTIFALFICPAMFLMTASHFTSELLDIVAPLNETRRHVSPVLTEYFVDQQKYFYLIAFYQNLIIVIIAITFIGTESIITMWIQHIASLCVIMCYRIRVGVQDSIADSTVYKNHLHGVNKYKLIKSVVLHRRVIKFVTDLMSTVAVSYSVLLILGVLSQSIILFRLSQSIFLINRLTETLISIMMITAILVYMFYINFVVQQAVDYGNSILTFLYCTDWYKTSVSTQKMLLLIMLKSSRDHNLNILIIFNPSIEGFSILLRTSMSYFMLMYSFQ